MSISNHDHIPAEERREINAQIRRAMELPDNFFECRSMGHAWERVQAFVRTDFGVPMCYHCTRCDMFRVDVVSRRYGELDTRWYIQPEGYHVKPPDDGTRSFSAAAFRAARLKRNGEKELPDIRPPEPE